MEELDSPIGGAGADCDTYDLLQLMDSLECGGTITLMLYLCLSYFNYSQQEWDEDRVKIFGSQNLMEDNLTEGEEEETEGEKEARGEPPKKRARCQSHGKRSNRGKRNIRGTEHKFQKSLEREMKKLVQKARDNSGVSHCIQLVFLH